ncbi:MAG: methylated-DNA--[protein]-cysteine S-methyltransferase [Bacteroidia bacterium]|nr:methylated-DNA--[protein]-cysteine S-methyltransferase [Bacteroidia bacterium]
MHLASWHSPLGWINIEATDWSVIAVYFTPHPHEIQSDHPLVREAVNQLKDYFEGKLTVFRLPIDPPGTVFQRQVWEEIQKIPLGQTWTYQRLAMRLGDESKIRAVAAANGANPIAIIIPCHRVLGSNGQLTGYAWGLDKKDWLLHHEQHREQLRLF